MKEALEIFNSLHEYGKVKTNTHMLPIGNVKKETAWINPNGLPGCMTIRESLKSGIILENKVYAMQELLSFVPKDIRDVATFTWEELNEIFGSVK